MTPRIILQDAGVGMALSLINCINQEEAIGCFMRLVASAGDNRQAFDGLMEEIGRYFQADRSCVFELGADHRFCSCTFEWCHEGVSPEIQKAERYSVKGMDSWFSQFRQEGGFYLKNSDSHALAFPRIHQALCNRGVEHLLAAPFIEGGQTVGFLSIDNPRAHCDQILLLEVMAASLHKECGVVHELEKAQARQHFSDSFYQELIQLQSCGVFAYRLSTYEVLAVNEAARRIYQFAPGAPLTRNEIFRAAKRVTFDNPRDVQKLKTMSEKGGSMTYTIQVVHDDGKVVHALVSSTLLVTDDDDQVIISSLQDVSDLFDLKEDYRKESFYNRSLLESLNCGVLSYTLISRRLLRANAEALRIYGWADEADAQARIAQSMVQVTYPDPTTVEHLKRLEIDGAPHEFEFVVNHEDGRSINCWGRCKLITGVDGEPTIVTTFEDVSNVITLQAEKERTETINAQLMTLNAQLDDSRKVAALQLETVAEAIHGGFKTSKNDAAFTFTYVSEQLACMLGYTVDEMMEASGGTMAGIVNVEDARREIPGALQSIAAGEMYTMNYRMRCKDGSWKNVEDRGRLIHTPSGVDEFWCFISDKDELTQKTQSLKSVKEQLNIIKTLAASYTSLFYFNLSTFYCLRLSAVHNEEEIFGAVGDARDSFETMFTRIVKPEYQQEMRIFCDFSTLNERLRDKVWISHQYEDTIHGWSEGMFVAAERDEAGNVVHVIWSTKNIDEQKKLDLSIQKDLTDARAAAEAANQAKTSFLFNMSHDIRTPINVIMGFTDLLEKHQENPERRADYLNKIRESSGVLLSIVNNVLEMARIETGHMTLKEEVTDAPAAIATLGDTFQQIMETKDISFAFDIQVDHQYIFADSLKTTQVFNNILSNAYKYTEPGGSVHMSSREIGCDRPGWTVIRTCISDTGIGMAPEFIPHIFEEFSREMTSTQSQIEGTGLGMPIVKRLVEFMGGTIEVESQQGVGSAFVVTLPHRIAHEGEYAQIRDGNKDSSLFAGKHLLLAEDNDLNAEIVQVILEEAGFSVTRVEEGAQCVRALKEAPVGTFDAVLMDVQMPVMDGYQATRAIRQMAHEAKAATPIVAMTANAFEEDKRAALEAGMNDHVAKPVDVALLMDVLAKLLL